MKNIGFLIHTSLQKSVLILFNAVIIELLLSVIENQEI